MMKKNNKGFTLAELLIVVAITVVLMGVAFIAVQNYQRSSTRLEYDGIAKEIFIAAQNHLTTAQSQGYLQLSTEKYGIAGTYKNGSDDDEVDKNYFVSKNIDNATEMLDLMLPFGAIDETVRGGGTYVIRYQPSSALVLDVFYSLPGRSSMLTVSGVELGSGDYKTLMEDYRGTDKTRARERFAKGETNYVVGWYGGEEGLPIGTHLDEPEIIVHNEEVLWVEVIDKNPGVGSLQLIVTGVTSKAQKALNLREFGDRIKNGKKTNEIDVVLDDITTSRMHFADLDSVFFPGEDVIIEAVAYNNAALTNVAYSGKKTTNSLFADLEEVPTALDEKEHIALIENFRHLENLDKTISGFKHDGAIKKPDETFETITKAKQIKELDWNSDKDDSFIKAVTVINGASTTNIYDNSNSVVATNNCYYPVSPHAGDATEVAFVLDYDGQNHKVSNVTINNSAPAGMFGTLTSGCSVKNLELSDFNITSTSGNAGALVGTVTGTEINNVLAYNKTLTGLDPTVTGTGSVGGLIGSATNCTVEDCAAALVVGKKTITDTHGEKTITPTNAGGLIGTSSDGEVKSSYSGGHTKEAKYYDGSTPIYNVTASGKAGGLIGDAGSTTIKNSYSTCSVTGANAGGFVGTASGEISNCYCTGLVKGTTTEGAFAASLGETATSCLYYEIINERPGTEKGFIYLNALGEEKTESGISGIDDNVESYNKFVGGESTWYPANPYDSQLRDFYNGKYPLRTVSQIAADNKVKNEAETGIGATHYGDWPSPEIFVINTATSSS